MDLVKLDLVDLISSDYVPYSLLQLAGDRGSLEVGKRADLLAVHCDLDGDSISVIAPTNNLHNPWN